MFTFLRVLLLALFAQVAFAAEPPSEPILRIDSGEHTANIRSIATDDAGRYLVTTSADKTARVWNLADGKLLSTLRIPIGSGNEGKLNAVAMSSDGQTVAVGGWTGWDYDGSASVFLFDRASGRLLRRLTGLPDIILCLAFSPDGRALAVTLGGGKGLRLFSVTDGRLLAEDRDYGDRSQSAHFSNDGHLVTTSWDGLLRLYRFDGNGLSLLVKRTAPGGTKPQIVRFSPDGKRVAVGFYHSAAVDVLNADDLSFNYAADTAGVFNMKESDGIADMHAVSWSSDGTVLFATGNSQRNDQFYIRRWSDAGKGRYVDWTLSSGAIFAMLPLADGRLVYGSSAPSWGVVSRSGERTIHHASVVADFRDNSQGFTLSNDGARVGFGYEDYGKSPAVFDAQQRSFVAATKLAGPVINAPGLNVTDWNINYAPKLNGQPLSLMANERADSLALLPQGDGFVLGTDWNLRLFDRNGNRRWILPVPGAVWAVNVSQDGRWVVAAYADGTIRWHRASDGAEQLAFFPHADKKRWVLWTPSGYYDASPGAEELIGWHVNRGKDHAADFFPASRFRERFYRPDLIEKILSTQDEAEALRQANEASGRRQTATVSVAQVLPPVLELLSAAELETGETTLTLRYRTRTAADAPVTAVRARVNGQAQSGERVLRPVRAEGEQSIQVTIPPQNSEIQVFAENRFGVSVPVTVRVTWKGKVAAAGFVIKPKLYVLAVGVANYSSADIPKLGLSAKDARDFAATMQKQTGLYREVEVRLLTETEATRDNVVDGLEWLQKQVTQHDVGMLFMAGHGVNDATAGYYYLPVDANPDKLKRTGVSMADIRGTLASLTGKAVFFIDTCHAGNALGGGRRALDNNLNGVINELSSAENGVVVFSSSTGSQYSLENAAWGNGAFTKALIEGMNGGADYQRTGRITHKMLDLFISERVKALTNGQQSPVTQAPGGVPDFPVAAGR
jgi:WD40 repeat protein